jgi:hypothetical protein
MMNPFVVVLRYRIKGNVISPRAGEETPCRRVKPGYPLGNSLLPVVDLREEDRLTLRGSRRGEIIFYRRRQQG